MKPKSDRLSNKQRWEIQSWIRDNESALDSSTKTRKNIKELFGLSISPYLLQSLVADMGLEFKPLLTYPFLKNSYQKLQSLEDALGHLYDKLGEDRPEWMRKSGEN